MLELLNEALDDSFVGTLLVHDGVYLCPVLELDIIDKLLQVLHRYGNCLSIIILLLKPLKFLIRELTDLPGQLTALISLFQRHRSTHPQIIKYIAFLHFSNNNGLI